MMEHKVDSSQFNGNGGNGGGNSKNAPVPISLGDFVQPHSGGNTFKEFIEMGKNIFDLLMRTNVLDMNEATDIGEIISYCEKYKLDRPLRKVYLVLAARPSIGMAARLQLLQASTGIISPQMNGFRGKAVGKRNSDEEKNNDPNKR